MTKLQFRVLYRQFLFRMVDLELLSAHAQGDISKLFGQFASLLIFLSLLFSVPALGFGSRIQPQGALILAWSMEHFLIATTMLVVGLFAVLSWDSTFPDRKDVLVLAPLPVRARTLFVAKVAAVATALSLTVVTLHVAAGLVWPLTLTQVPPQNMPSLASDPALPAVDAARLQPMLDRDFAQVLKPGSGLLAPGSGAGIAIGVSTHGVRRVFSYGSAQPDSLFEIGSLTKTFTGLVLAQLAVDGRVRLNQPVRELLPEGTVSQPKGNEITLLDLATHHSGLPREAANLHPADRANPYADYSPADLYAYLGPRGVAKPDGASFLYSNLGFGLLGQALVNRTGMAYPRLVEQEVTGPLGMRDTAVTLSPEQQSRFMQGYDAQRHPVRAFDLDALAGAGALRSTAGDILTYLEAQLHPEKFGRTLAAALAQSHQLRADMGPDARIGLAWFYDASAGHYLHSGATAGHTTFAAFSPRGDYAVVVLSNTGCCSVISGQVLGEHIRSRLSGAPAISVANVAIPESRGFSGLLRLLAVYWITMLAAGAFIFCCVLGVQGLAAQLLPRRLFLRASSFLQLAAFCLFVCGYFLQPILATPDALLQAQRNGPLSWSPSYWFLGLFQELNGSPALAPLAHRAWIGLASVLCVTAVAYVLSYLRTLRKIVEEPDIVPSSRGARWLPGFGKPMPTAVVQFSVRTLLRSRQHRMILAFYLGIAFAITIFFLRSPEIQRELSTLSESDPWHQVNAPLLASSIVLMGFWVVGIRVVFSMPLDLRANWVFRVTPVRGGLDCLAARRRSLLVLSVLPVCLVAAPLFFSIWPWRPAAGHLVILGLVGLILAEICLNGAQKIPFTCSYLPGKSSVHLTFWLCIGLLLTLIEKAAQFEQRALDDSASYAVMLAILGALAGVARWRTVTDARSEETGPRFEDEPSSAVLVLGLSGDGAGPG